MSLQLTDGACFAISGIEEVLSVSPFVEVLDCQGMGITSLPDDLHFPNLKRWDLSGNNITELPGMYLPVLTHFDLHNNQLQTLPENFSHMVPSLRELNLGYNRVLSLPDLSSLHGLRRLHLYHNLLTVLPTFQFSNLKVLGVSNNNLTSLPEDMNLPKLRELTCLGNPLTCLPQNMHCPKLNVLDVPFTQPTLPSGVGSSRLAVNSW